MRFERNIYTMWSRYYNHSAMKLADVMLLLDIFIPHFKFLCAAERFHAVLPSLKFIFFYNFTSLDLSFIIHISINIVPKSKRKHVIRKKFEYLWNWQVKILSGQLVVALNLVSWADYIFPIFLVSLPYLWAFLKLMLVINLLHQLTGSYDTGRSCSFPHAHFSPKVKKKVLFNLSVA